MKKYAWCCFLYAMHTSAMETPSLTRDVGYFELPQLVNDIRMSSSKGELIPFVKDQFRYLLFIVERVMFDADETFLEIRDSLGSFNFDITLLRLIHQGGVPNRLVSALCSGTTLNGDDHSAIAGKVNALVSDVRLSGRERVAAFRLFLEECSDYYEPDLKELKKRIIFQLAQNLFALKNTKKFKPDKFDYLTCTLESIVHVPFVRGESGWTCAAIRKQLIYNAEKLHFLLSLLSSRKLSESSLDLLYDHYLAFHDVAGMSVSGILSAQLGRFNQVVVKGACII